MRIAAKDSLCGRVAPASSGGTRGHTAAPRGCEYTFARQCRSQEPAKAWATIEQKQNKLKGRAGSCEGARNHGQDVRLEEQRAFVVAQFVKFVRAVAVAFSRVAHLPVVAVSRFDGPVQGLHMRVWNQLRVTPAAPDRPAGLPLDAEKGGLINVGKDTGTGGIRVAPTAHHRACTPAQARSQARHAQYARGAVRCWWGRASARTYTCARHMRNCSWIAPNSLRHPRALRAIITLLRS